MDFDDIVKIVDQVKVLEARLAVAQAEREKYQGLADNRLNCLALYRDLIGKHEARIGVLADKLNVVEAERDAARAEAEKLRDKAELLDEIIANRISVSYRDGIPVTAHIWSARTDDGFGTGNTLTEALAALRAAKGGQ